MYKEQTSIFCPQCGKAFINTHKKQIYCSRSCYYKARVGKVYKITKAVCENCGKIYQITKWMAKDRKYCSRVCMGEKMRGKNAANWKGGEVSKICLFCGKKFFVKTAVNKNGRGKYCSKKCFNAIRIKRTPVPCPTCGKIRQLRDSEIKRERVFCNQKCYRLHHPTSIESKVRNFLTQNGIEFIPEHDFKRWSIDIFIPSNKLAIECDGEYWHRNTAKRDAKKDSILLQNGIKVLRLKEKDIRNNFEECENLILNHIHTKPTNA